MQSVETNPQNVDETTDVPRSQINGQDLKKYFQAGLTWLKTNQQIVNSLNVFPVPDGDTGTNMFLTLKTAYAEIEGESSTNAGSVAKKFAHGALMGARGNSGVILSQILRGFARALDEKEMVDADMLVQALSESRNTAYKGVVRPVEGTILTVIKDVARASEKSRQSTNDLSKMLDDIVTAADTSVKNTPELLPILKQAGVVDSGGKGLFFILEGISRYLRGESLEISQEAVVTLSLEQMQESELDEAIEPGQDFEVVVDFEPEGNFNLPIFYEALERVGTSIQVGEGENLYRMHIHVPKEKKYEPIDLVMEYGTVKKVYIENLMEQMKDQKASQAGTTTVKPPAIEAGQIAVVAVSPGDGITKIFYSLGLAAVIQGGQTMNPSTEEIVESFSHFPTDKIIILPNNKNIILAAEAAKHMSNKQVRVVPTRSIPEGLTASLMINPDGDLDGVVESMNNIIKDVDSGEITTATRSIVINGIDVKSGEVISLLNDELVGSANTLETACDNLLKAVDLDEKEHLTILCGNNVSKEQVESVLTHLRDNYPDLELEVHDGGQPFYQFIIAIE
ncbi:MAG: DAK2 domain-containing protein [Chloroflexi bacterium]|nr:DAK2 domain-containing protein [Chloroflexota bacterium]